jgi:chromosome segregation ATPase
MTPDTGLIIDLIVIALLAATIFYAFRLERRLANMRNAQTALAEVIRELNTAAARAEAGIQGLKAAAASSGHTLDEKTKRARSLADELGLLLQAGERLGQRIEAARPQNFATPRAKPRMGSEALRTLAGAR